MTISTTRSRIRTIGSTTLAATVGLGFGALSVVAASPASAGPVSKDITYLCDVNGDIGGDGNVEVPFTDLDFIIGTASTLPDSVMPGELIPATAATISLNMPNNLRDSAPAVLGPWVKGFSDNTAVSFTINGVKSDKLLTAPGGTGPIGAPSTLIPTAPTPWVIPVAGEVPAVQVPADATGTIVVEAPSAFTIKAEHSDTENGPMKSLSTVICALKAGQADDALKLGEIPIAGTAPDADTTIAGPTVTSEVGTDTTVALSVTPAAATGDVTLSLEGKEVGKGALANGATSIVIPAATLPTAGTFALQARYAGAKGFKTSSATVTVVRTAAAVTPPAEPAKAKITAKVKPKQLKIGKKGKVKITIKSDSADKSGKITIKAGKKTLGKGKTNAKGKATIKLKKVTAKLVKKGKIKLTITFGGNDETKKAKKNVKVKVKK